MKSRISTFNIPSVRARGEIPRVKLVAVITVTFSLIVLTLSLVGLGPAESAAGTAIAKRMPEGQPPQIGPQIHIGWELAVQSEPAAAFDGTNYMVVWEDGRGPLVNIYGARVDSTGAVLDPRNILIARADPNLRNPAIAFDGTNYMAVWEYDGVGIYGTRITLSGTVLDPDGIPIHTKSGEHRFPHIAFDGTNYLVVWQGDSPLSWRIRGARVTPSGTVLDPDGFRVSGAENAQIQPELAFDGTNYMVVWQDNSAGHGWNVYGARVTPSRIVLDPAGFLIAGGDKYQQSPDIAFDGTNYMVAWVHDSITLLDIHGARVSPSGTVLDPTPIVISPAEYGQHDPCIAFNGTDYVAAWYDHRAGTSNIYAARVDMSGTVLDPDGFPIWPVLQRQYNPAIASGNSDQMLVCYDSGCVFGNLLNPLVSLEADVEFEPGALNLNSHGKYVTAYIELPEGYDPSDIDVATVTLNGVIPAQVSPTSVGDFDADGITDRMVKFDRSALIALVGGADGVSLWLSEGRADIAPLNDGDEFEVTVAGELMGGESFSGTDLVRVVVPGPGEAPPLAVSVFPNVFKNTVSISYEVADDAPVSLRIYDVAGRSVKTLVNEHKPAGRYVVTWDRTANDGHRIGTGVYFIRVEHKETVVLRKVLAVQ